MTKKHSLLSRRAKPNKEPVQGQPQPPLESTPEPVHVATPISEPATSVAYADDDRLREVQDRCTNIEEQYPNQAVLYIGSEQYDAMTVTVIEGLRELGFTVYTPDKPNINSWFCNSIAETEEIADGTIPIDFAISNLGWGVQWSMYDKDEGIVPNVPRILIDSDVARGNLTWQQKASKLKEKLLEIPPEEMSILDMPIQPYRWTEDEGDYIPDVIFTAQPFDEYDAVYQPIGIQRAFDDVASSLPQTETIPFVYIPLNRKRRVDDWVVELDKPVIIERNIRGMTIVDPDIAQLVASGGKDGVHGWDQWMFYEGYYDLLNKARCVIYPDHWGSRRPWEALACNAFLLMEKPSIDMSDYSIIDAMPFCTFGSKEELAGKVSWLSAHPNQMEKMRIDAGRMASQYFDCVPLARRMLWYISQKVGAG